MDYQRDLHRLMNLVGVFSGTARWMNLVGLNRLVIVVLLASGCSGETSLKRSHREFTLSDDPKELIELLVVEKPSEYNTSKSSAAYKKLRKMGTKAFSALINSIHDERYSCKSLQMATEGRTTVGDVCLVILRSQIEEVFGGARSPHYIKRGSINRWWDTRKNRSLKELQVEAFDQILQEIRNNPKYSNNLDFRRSRAEYYISNLEAYLKRTPIIEDMSECYDGIKKVKEIYKKKSRIKMEEWNASLDDDKSKLKQIGKYKERKRLETERVLEKCNELLKRDTVFPNNKNQN